MLQQNAVPSPALELLKNISDLHQFNTFALGGGSNLALRYGHRLSVDLDFFTNIEFDTQSIFHLISKNFPSSELLFEKNQTILFSINDVKVDFVLYPFPWLQSFDIIDDFRLLSVRDIIPMKFQAVSNRNAKKDYWDIAALLDNYSLEEMLTIFKLKFPNVDLGFIIHSLTDYEKADTEIDPDTYNNKNWDDIKLQLTTAVRNYTTNLL